MQGTLHRQDTPGHYGSGTYHSPAEAEKADKEAEIKLSVYQRIALGPYQRVQGHSSDGARDGNIRRSATFTSRSIAGKSAVSDGGHGTITLHR